MIENLKNDQKNKELKFFIISPQRENHWVFSSFVLLHICILINIEYTFYIHYM